MRVLMIGVACLALGACATLGTNPPLVSGASPAAANSPNLEPQSVDSLPPGAAGLQTSGPNSVAPNYASGRFKAF